MLTWHCCRYGELSAAAESLLNHEAFSPMCSCFCGAESREKVPALEMGKGWRNKGQGCRDSAGQPCSHILSQMGVPHPRGLYSSPLLRTSPLKQADEKLLFKLWAPPGLLATAPLTSIRVKPFLISNGSFPLFSLCMLPQDLFLCPSEESGSVFSVPPVW